MATEREVPIEDAADGQGSTGEAIPDLGDSRFPGLYPGEQHGSPEALREEVEFWRHAFDSLVWNFPEYVFVVDDEGALTHVNTQNDDVSEELVDEMLGLQAADLFGTEDGGTLADEVVRAGETIKEEEVRAGTANDGSTYHVRAGATPITTPDGEVVAAFEVVTDVTEIVEEITENIETTVDNVAAANDRIDDAIGQIQDLMANQQDIIEAVSETSVGMDEIADATGEQSQSAEEVTSMLGTAVEGVNQVSAEIQELAAANEQQVERVSEVRESIRTIEEHIEESAEE